MLPFIRLFPMLFFIFCLLHKFCIIFHCTVFRFNPGDDQNLPLLQYQPQFLTQQANMPNTHLPFHPPQPPYLPQMYSQPPNTSMMHVPTGLFSSPPPILNLQEFISVFTPGSDSPSFSYPNGIMSRDATAADNNAAVTAGSVGHEGQLACECFLYKGYLIALNYSRWIDSGMMMVVNEGCGVGGT